MKLTGCTLLVVEDDADNLELLVSHFEQEGALVVSSPTIGGALSSSSARHIDALVCDLDLPDGEGGSLLRQLREREGSRDLPALAISGYSDDHWRRIARDCGFARFALKPFKLEQLTDWILELIERQSGTIGKSCHGVTEPAAHVPLRR